jgi:RNA polymerase sigma-54 factor
MIRNSLELRQGQRLTVTPQMQHAIGLLQLSGQELAQEIREALDSNVFLECDDSGPELPSAAPPAQRRDASAPPLGPDLEMPEAEPDLRGHLRSQLALEDLCDRDWAAALLLLDAIDDDGYLVCAPGELADTEPRLGLKTAELEAVRARIQNLDPVGCGSVGLADCLTAQLRHRRVGEPLRPVCERLASLAPAELMEPVDALAERTACEPEVVAAALEVVRSLNPYPGRGFARGGIEYIVPDVLVTRRAGRWIVRLNDALAPRLRLNRTYESLMAESAAGSHAGMQGQLQEARWLLRSIEMRHQTLLKVAGAIVRRQQAFLEHGEIAMRPMVLEDVAEEVEMHESTVSRVTTSKYMYTPRGIFELKYFFSSRLSTRGGGRCSSTAVRALIRSIIDSEESGAPLSDGAVARMLSDQGVCVARRTVAKYRESLGIPPLSERLQRSTPGRAVPAVRAHSARTENRTRS